LKKLFQKIGVEGKFSVVLYLSYSKLSLITPIQNGQSLKLCQIASRPLLFYFDVNATFLRQRLLNFFCTALSTADHTDAFIIDQPAIVSAHDWKPSKRKSRTCWKRL